MNRRRRSTCGEVRGQLALAAGQDLSDTIARQVWAHLAGCMVCRREYSVFLEHRAALAELEPSRGAPLLGPAFFRDLEQGVMARIGEPDAGSPLGARWRIWAGVAAAVLLVVGAATIPGWEGDGLLHREPIQAQAARPRPAPVNVPLSYPQGLLGRQQVDLLFARESVPTWPVHQDGAPPSDPLLRRVRLPQLDDR